ncbi:hypothetical protein WAE41_25480 [Pseudomonas aeruginosa]|uniref:hypothetical protein n=1 Tax=Pseudomonas aeruginosa TaxID=287 RepID=UPI00301C0C0E
MRFGVWEVLYQQDFPNTPKEQRDIAVSDWNTRAVPADHVVVQRELLERLYSSDTATALMAAAELRSLLNP